MGQKIILEPITKGLRKDVTAFNIDNDAFPTLINAYQWRGRIKRKRGTSPLGRLTRYFNSLSISYNTGSTTITLDGSGNGNILSGFSIPSNASIVPGSVSITYSVTPVTYTDPAKDGTLSPSGSINYASGAIVIAAQAGHAVSATFLYYPSFPVMGLEDLNLNVNQLSGTIGFDTVYSYNISNSFPYSIYDISFYKNPVTGAYTNYVQKTNVSPLSWNGADYQQFGTVNYQGALWATNGIMFPFSTTGIGMQYNPIVSTTVTAGGPPATVSLQITAHGLVVGDFLFINEVATTTGINFQTGYVTTVTDANNVIVTFPNAVIASNGTGGIAQYLTSRSDITRDCIRWYDGDPTNGNASNPTLNGAKGWVNFCPPLSQSTYGISDLPSAQYYLAGARMIVPFKDRLLFIGPVVQTSSAGSQIYLADTVLYSQNGTPYYTASFQGAVNSSATVFNPILTPLNQTGFPPAFFEDQTGFGGFISSGLGQVINTQGPNKDVLILGLDSIQTKLVYTGNDIVPFNFYLINSELGSFSTFSSVNTDDGVLTMGSRGFVITNENSCIRVDLDIPDQIFQLNLRSKGASSRVCSQRDFVNEWIYFTYPANSPPSKFPNQTLQYNYRDMSWAIFNECYTTYGSFKRRTGYTWASIGTVFPTWSQWNESWNAGSSTLLQPEVIAGNQQGFICFRDDGTAEANSLAIQNISSGTITCIDHTLSSGDYIVISGALGTIDAYVNNKIFSVNTVTDTNSFTLNPTLTASGTYLGGGVIKRAYLPLIQTKQFPTAWALGRKTRIGVQQYLFSATYNSQITLLIYLSQNSSSAYNTGPIVPDPNSINNSLIYSSVLYTCPESTNLGLTPANINLQTPTAIDQQQIWHRMNTSLIGDTVQIGFTLSDAQMRDPTLSNQFAEIEFHGAIIDVNPSQLLV